MIYSSQTILSKRYSFSNLVSLGFITYENFVGDKEASINRVRPLGDAVQGDLTFCTTRKNLDSRNLIRESTASIIITDLKGPFSPKSGQVIIEVDNAKLAFSKLLSKLVPHNLVVSGSYQHGDNFYKYPNVVIYDDVQIGNNVTIHSGTVIGHPGLGPIGNEESGWEQFHDIGTVIIEDDVQIGSNCCIAKSPLASTIIGKGTKIANIVNIGHNAIIGENVVIASMTMIARSKIGNGTWIGPSVSIRPGVTIGSKSIIGVGSNVVSDIPDHVIALGNPARIVKQIDRIEIL